MTPNRIILTLLLAVACAPASSTDDPHIVPPWGEDAIEAWFAAGYYLEWTCEPALHASQALSPHGAIRTCANPIAEPDGVGEHPVDTSLVVEIADDTGTAVAGHGAMRHTAPGTTPDTWYWYMKVPLDNTTVHDDNGLAADGWGFEEPPQTYCAACHAMAGTSGNPGHDFVFSQP